MFEFSINIIINHCRFDLDMPIYVNMVRDPVERVISWYYYVRAPWYFVERKRAFPELPLPNPNWLRKVSDGSHIHHRECPVLVQSRTWGVTPTIGPLTLQQDLENGRAGPGTQKIRLATYSIV